jgi:phosphatidate cytidylyltransferase
MSNFLKRAITGAFFVAVVIAVIFQGVHALGFLFAFFSAIGILEYHAMLKAGGLAAPAKWRTLVVSLIIHQAFWLAVGFENLAYYALAVFAIAVTMVIEMFSHSSDLFERMQSTLFAHLWITIPFASMTTLGMALGNYEPLLVFGFFALLWTNDTGAYLVGRAVGRTKLAPTISPGKTVEGFIGGVALTFALSYGFSVWFSVLPMTDWLFIAGVIGVFSNAGDLVESVVKRRCGVKDSGTLLPGHGGVLDRFDGILLSVPVIVAYLRFINT